MPTTEIKLIKPTGGGDYISLNAWDIGERADLVASDKIKVAEVYGGGSAVLLTGYSLGPGWTTDHTRYVEIRAATGQEHPGYFHSGKAMLRFTDNAGSISISENVKLRKLQLVNESSSTCLYYAPGSPGGDNNQLVVDRCLIYNGDSNGAVRIVNGGNDTSYPIIFKNSLIMIPDDEGGQNATAVYISGGFPTAGTVAKFYNCIISTSIGGGVGIKAFYLVNFVRDCTLENCYVRSVNDWVLHPAFPSVLNVGNGVATYDAGAYNINLRNIPWDHTTFKKTYSKNGLQHDLHSVPGSRLIDAGVDLSGGANESAIIEDVDGDPRTGDFDIGFDEYNPPPVVCDGNFNTPLCWESISTVAVGAASSLYDGVTNAPNHVYFLNDTQFIRYDRSGPFTAGSSWEVVDRSTVGVLDGINGDSLSNSVYDGSRYIYYSARYALEDFATKAKYIRYDTQNAFNSSGSWEQLPMSAVVPSFPGNTSGMDIGVIVVSNYVYYVPFGNSYFVRYDKTLPFTSASSYEVIIQNLVGGGGSYISVTYDGRYIYYCPYESTTFIRYDTLGAFLNPASWSSVTKTSLGINDRCTETISDGRYIYFGTDNTFGNTRVSSIVRYDSTLPFTAAGSWEQVLKFDVSLDSEVRLAYYSSPYVYGYQEHDNQGDAIRYNTTQPFTSPFSYERSYFYTRDGGRGDGYGSSYDTYMYFNSGSNFVRWNANGGIPICWNYTAKYKSSKRLFKVSGCGSFPKTLKVPSNVDKSTGRMIDDGIFINPDEYNVKQ